MNFGEMIRERLRAEIDRQHLSCAAVAVQSGIPRGTLRRRLSGQGRAFNCVEIERVAAALGMGVGELLLPAARWADAQA